jgi:hypothetical protein
MPDTERYDAQPLSDYIANLPADADRIGFVPVLFGADESGITNALAYDAPWHRDVPTVTKPEGIGRS